MGEEVASVPCVGHLMGASSLRSQYDQRRLVLCWYITRDRYAAVCELVVVVTSRESVP